MSTTSHTPPPRPATATGSKPRIKINIPQPGHINYYNPASPYLNTAHSNPSQFSGGAPQWPPSSPYINPFATPNPKAAGEFVFKQFAGIKGFTNTWDWTKSGLNKGEKMAFTLYQSISSWSKRWFTHIFLMFIMFVYSVAGAYIFAAVEGTCITVNRPICTELLHTFWTVLLSRFFIWFWRLWLQFHFWLRYYSNHSLQPDQ